MNILQQGRHSQRHARAAGTYGNVHAVDRLGVRRRDAPEVTPESETQSAECPQWLEPRHKPACGLIGLSA